MHNDEVWDSIAAAVLSRSAVPDSDAPDLSAVRVGSVARAGPAATVGPAARAGGDRAASSALELLALDWWAPAPTTAAMAATWRLGGGCRQWQVVPTPWGPQWRLVSVCYAPVGYGYGYGYGFRPYPVGFYGGIY